METRKIQKTGGSTYIVSIPKKWARGRVKEGDEVYVEDEEDSVRVYFKERPRHEREVTLKYEEPISSLIRKVIACYLSGYDLITIKSDEVMDKKSHIEKMVRERMMGLEVIDESSKEIKLQNLLKHSDLQTKGLLQRMNSIIISMYEDVIESMTNGDENLLKDVIKRENEIDRLYLFGVRQMESAVMNKRTREKLDIESKRVCLGYRVIIKSMERISDHLKMISARLLEMEDRHLDKKVVSLVKESLESYTGVMESLSKKEGELAEKYIQKSKSVDDKSEKVRDDIRENEKLKDIISSIDRTRKLSRDIAEIVINFSVGKKFN